MKVRTVGRLVVLQPDADGSYSCPFCGGPMVEVEPGIARCEAFVEMEATAVEKMRAVSERIAEDLLG